MCAGCFSQFESPLAPRGPPKFTLGKTPTMVDRLVDVYDTLSGHLILKAARVSRGIKEAVGVSR